MILSYKPYFKKDTYTADFETLSGDVDETWVYAWSLCNILDIDTCDYGNNIESFFENLENTIDNKITVYFHNLSHDGKFILYYLFRNGAEYCDKFNESNKMQFNCLIGDDGSFFNIKVKLKKRKVVTFRDSSKKIPGTVAEISESWQTKYKKTDLDCNEYHEPGELLTDTIIDRVCNDSRIIAEVIKKLYDYGFTAQTIATDSNELYKKMYPFYYMDMPKLAHEEDEFCRKAYKGGWCFLNPIYENKEVKSGVIYDINSSYPGEMSNVNNMFPVGKGIYFTGKPEKNEKLYICHIRANIYLKKDKFPGLTIKRAYSTCDIPVYDTECMEDFYLTSIDMEVLEECYNIVDIQYIDGYYYNKKNGETYFGDFINQLYSGKSQSKGAKRQTYKILMNSSYGKYGQKPVFIKKIPIYKDDCITYIKEECNENKQCGYVPLAAFITSYARRKVIYAANANYERFVYCDTDSLHLIGQEAPYGIEMDKTILGKWDDEFYFERGKYIRQKVYMLLASENVKLCCAGMSKNCKEIIEHNIDYYYSRFSAGLEIKKGNLKAKQVKGGVTLVLDDYKLKVV